MKKTPAILGLVVLLLLGAGTLTSAGPVAPQAAAFEYHSFQIATPIRLTDRFNELGKDGWEFVGQLKNGEFIEAVFKRPRKN